MLKYNSIGPRKVEKRLDGRKRKNICFGFHVCFDTMNRIGESWLTQYETLTLYL